MKPARVNPRTVILDVLREGPKTWEEIEYPHMWEAISGGSTRSCPMVDRWLYKLRRAGRVARLPDGRWALRTRPLRLCWPVGKGDGEHWVCVKRGGRSWRLYVTPARFERVRRALRIRSEWREARINIVGPLRPRRVDEAC